MTYSAVDMFLIYNLFSCHVECSCNVDRIVNTFKLILLIMLLQLFNAYFLPSLTVVYGLVVILHNGEDKAST